MRKPKSNVDFGYAAAELFAAREREAVGNERGEGGWEWDDDDGDGDERWQTMGRRKRRGVKGAPSDEDGAAKTVKWTPLPGPGSGMVVYMDYAQGRSTWGLAQHRALEMVLTRYPEARVVVLQVAPGGWICGFVGLGWRGVYVEMCFNQPARYDFDDYDCDGEQPHPHTHIH